MTQLFANNAYSSLASSASNSTTTLTLATGTGTRFPSPTAGNYFLLTLTGLDSNGNESSWEIVKVTARSTDTLTVVRGQESTTAVAWTSGTRVESRATAGTFSGLAPIDSPVFTSAIKGDFSNATASSRVAFQTATSNASTIVSAKPSGTGTASYLQAFNASDADNAGYVYLGITGSVASINSAKTGTGTVLPIVFSVDSSEKMRISGAGNVGIGKSAPDQLLQLVGGNIDLQEQLAGRRIGFYVGDAYTSGTVGGTVSTARYGLTFGSYIGSSVNLGGWGGVTLSTNDLERFRITNNGEMIVKSGLQQTKTAMAAANIDLSTGNVFTKTFTSGAITLTVSNVPATGTVASFILDATNAGTATITWWSGVKWSGSAPTLTASGRDSLGFYTHDGGTTWTGLVLGKDIK